MRSSLLLLLAAMSPALADVSDVASNGFTTVNEIFIDADIERVWHAATSELAAWWNPDHTLSGDASRMNIDLRPMGCFCERFGPDAGMVHLVVTAVSPRSLVRLTGGLGPLGVMGVNGNMTWEFDALETGTRVRFTYAVGGYSKDGLDKLAGPVDFVINDALTRLASHVQTGAPESKHD